MRSGVPRELEFRRGTSPPGSACSCRGRAAANCRGSRCAADWSRPGARSASSAANSPCGAAASAARPRRSARASASASAAWPSPRRRRRRPRAARRSRPCPTCAEMNSASAKARKPSFQLQLALDALARVLVGRVPLVHRDHHRAAALEDVAGDVRVLLGDAVHRVEHQHRDVGRLDRLQRLDDRELLDLGAVRLAALAQARRCRPACSAGRRARTAPRSRRAWCPARRRRSRAPRRPAR